MAILFLPSLAALLEKAEAQKGYPLTQHEVETLRDGAICISVPDELLRTMDPLRGYQDIDPKKCWEAWRDYRLSGNTRLA
ncbi:hypothetical protein Q3V30_08475 [Erwinia pyri]|uniref:Uncharacterized protein n=1 Tax=Erwinia pyri TaxID=3062598 RepID=A0AA50HS99_9GAMM|nr:hypothetical protein [Erwinia sp. DE2]WLS80498.1 hypothetical protein Q3V30_08475 [Erwinia sp. DE2]